MPAKCLAITNRKGGCGKTSVTASLCAELGRSGKRVLVIDCDEQCSISEKMLPEPLGDGDPTLYEVMLKGATIGKAIYEASKQFPNAYIMPSSPQLKPDDHALNSAISRETLLKRVVDTIRSKFDVILLDSPPALSIITVAILTAADAYIVPLGFDRSSLEGVEPVKEEVRKIEGAKLAHPKYLGAFCTQYGQSRYLATRDFDKIAAGVKGILSNYHIPISSQWKQAEMRNKTLQDDRSHPIAIGYQKLAKYISKELGI